MSAAPRHRVALLHGFLFFFCGGADGSEVPPPQNVITKTLNTNYTLSWDWPPGAAGTHAVTFTTQYVPKHQLKRNTPNWITACNQTSHRSCDLTRFKLLFIGDFMLRVRATVDGRHSEWAQKTFCPYEEAFIGPPDVTLHVTGTSLEVSIKDPVFKHSELRETYTSATYHITYWKSSSKEEVKKILETRQDRVVLSDLDPMSEYCVQVQIIYNRNPRPGEYSDVVCEHTGDVDAAPWVAAVVTFVVMATVVTLVVTLVVYWKQISKFLCPEVVLPPHFEEVCGLPPPSLLPFNPFIYPVSLPSEHCDQVSIVADHRTEEEEEGGCSTT
ncbi:interferon alpha/beta receptor 1a [Maylandia zebra]|uniref:interferon alpha/beta receptor 1a n=1 Tax=Maylandia zebra TaxID=106582 RepID=UPI00403C8219